MTLYERIRSNVAKKENHNAKPSDELTPLGIKAKATKTLTKLIKEIGQRKHTIDDEGRVVSKFEALAWLIWNKSLGYVEKDVKTGEETKYKPDRSFISMILDRTEGKVAPTVAGGAKDKVTVADRVGEQAKKRINQLAEKCNDRGD